MATAKQLLDSARRDLGYTESPPGSNRTKFGRWYGMDGAPWCAMFVSYHLDKQGITRFRHAYTPAGAELFRDAGRWFTSNPEPGDIVYFDFPDSLKRIQHVGFVEKVNPDGSVTTIEGNTSAGNQGSQDNGGGVFRRVRPRSVVVGFGRPNLTGSRKPARPSKRFKSKAWFGLGDSGADVAAWQTDLNRVMRAGLVVDGDFGPKTLAATKAFEKEQGLKVDGRVGKRALHKMEQLRRAGRAARTKR